MIVPGFIFDDATHVKPPAIGVGLRLYGSGSSYVGLISPATGSGLDWILPGNAGSNGNVLTTDGAHTMSWAAAGGASGANPTASVILSAVNGSAGTFMRSDGAPALSQGIAPTWTGAHAFALTAGTGTQSPGITFTGAAHTALTASTESNALNLNCSSTKQFATGALTTQREILVQAPTYGFVAASTITTAVTQEINGAPIQGTNATITNQIALRVLAGVATGIPLVLQGASSQSANFFECRDNLNAIVAKLSASGTITFNSLRSGVDCEFYGSLVDAVAANITDRIMIAGNDGGGSAGGIGLCMASGAKINWSSNAAGAADCYGNIDTGLRRLAAGVLATGDGATGKGWLQNSSGCGRNTADATNATTTFSNLTDLSITLIAGRKYFGRMVVKCNNSVASEGIKFDFNGGGATMTSFWAGVGLLSGSDVAGTTISTSLSGAMNFTTVTGENIFTLEFSLVCNAAGTFIPRFAENSHAAGTATVELGSYIFVEDSPN